MSKVKFVAADSREAILGRPGIRWLVEPTFDEDGVQRSAGIDEFGREHGDPVPLMPPVGLSVEQGDALHTALRDLFHRERARFMAAVEAEQFETEDEANDFLLPEDLFPPGNEPWEDIFEFPAGDEGRSQSLASEAPNGNGGPEKPPSQPSATLGEGKVSGGLVSESSVEKTEQKRTSVSSSSGESNQRDQSVGRR